MIAHGLGVPVENAKTQAEIELHDLTEFNGRCDAIILAKNMEFIPANESDALANFRATHLYLPKQPQLAGEFDLVVVGGGMAGITSAISAARLGCKVALISEWEGKAGRKPKNPARRKMQTIQ